MANTLVWADIPVEDLERARTFYAAMLRDEVPLMEGSEGKVALLPGAEEGVSADLAQMDEVRPSSDGPIIYLNARDDIEAMLQRVQEAGGTVLMPATPMGEIGTIAMILDSEGNRIGLHTPGQS